MLRRLSNLWRNLTGHRQLRRDLDDELRGSYDALVEELMAKGATPHEAQRAATLQFGRVETVRAQVLDVRAGAFWDPLVQDVRFGIRLLVRSPLFAVFAVASLALGIGASGAIFALLDGLVLRKLPVAEPDRLVVASFGRPDGRFNYSLPYPHFEQIRARSTTLAGLFAINPFGRVTVAVAGEPAIAQGLYVTGDYYHVLGLAPAAGRLLQPADDRPGVTVAVLSHAFWQRRFAGRAEVVGTLATINGRAFTIVGVEPAGFAGTEVGRPYDISLPMRASELLNESPPLWNEAFATWIYVIGRLAPGATLAEAERESRTIFAQVSLDAARSPTETRLARQHQLRLEPAATGGASDLRAGYARWLRLLMGVLLAVLLLASLNVATLLLSRADARRREISTRLALGAGRWRIVRQLLTESLVLAAMAGCAGLLLATWGARALLRIATPTADRLPLDVGLDLRLTAFVIGISVLTCLLFGLIPALRGTARSVPTGRQVGGGPGRRWLDRGLVVSQVAVSLVLLVGAGLFLRTLDRIWALDTGYDRRNVLMFSIDARLAGQKGPDVPATYQAVLSGLAGVPAARSVTASAVRPVSDSYYFVSSVSRVGETSLSNDRRIRVAYNNVAPGYFGTLGIPIVAGRDFDERDLPGSAPVVIVSERMARHFTGNPVGQRLGGGDSGSREIVGVVRDIRYANVKDAPREVLYFPMFQAEPKTFWYAPTFEIRFAGTANDIMSSVRAAVSRVNPALELFGVRTLEAQTEASLARERLLAVLTSYFGVFALVLSCIGLYGVLNDRVTLRTAEIGLRQALGARPAELGWLFLREAAVTVAAGVAAGLAAALAAVRVVRSQLFGVEPHDPLAIAGAVALLAVLAGLAAYLPARRASRLDPIAALRQE
jgi:predicted permease